MLSDKSRNEGRIKNPDDSNDYPCKGGCEGRICEQFDNGLFHIVLMFDVVVTDKGRLIHYPKSCNKNLMLNSFGIQPLTTTPLNSQLNASQAILHQIPKQAESDVSMPKPKNAWFFPTLNFAPKHHVGTPPE